MTREEAQRKAIAAIERGERESSPEWATARMAEAQVYATLAITLPGILPAQTIKEG